MASKYKKTKSTAKTEKRVIVEEDVALDEMLEFLWYLVDPKKQYISIRDMHTFDQLSCSNPDEIARRALHTMRSRAILNGNGEIAMLALKKLDYLDSNLFVPEYISCIDPDVSV